MYKYIALTALALGSAALGFNMNRGGGEQFTVGLLENHGSDYDQRVNLSRTASIDIDNDGLDDILNFWNDYENNVLVLRARMNLGNVSFSPWEILSTYEFDLSPECSGAPYAGECLVMNINGDSYPDIAVEIYEECEDDDWNWIQSYGTVYFINNGSGGFACAGDVTGDGTTNVDDLLGVIGDWGCTDQGLPD